MLLMKIEGCKYVISVGVCMYEHTCGYFFYPLSPLRPCVLSSLLLRDLDPITSPTT